MADFIAPILSAIAVIISSIITIKVDGDKTRALLEYRMAKVEQKNDEQDAQLIDHEHRITLLESGGHKAA